jgi:RNA 2',3'-cyclic 3'-phosphodiesterase
MRAFLAVEVNPELVYKISEIQKKLAEANAMVKFVETENLHFTFKFLGDITPEKADNIVEITEEKLKPYSPFNIKIRGTGVFPNMGYIRVIWLGVEHPGAFSKVQRELDEEFSKMGFKKERSYTPHLTIGRVKGTENKELLVSIVKELEDVEIGTMKVDRLILKKSELTPVGPMYTDLKEIFL